MTDLSEEQRRRRTERMNTPIGLAIHIIDDYARDAWTETITGSSYELPVIGGDSDKLDLGKLVKKVWSSQQGMPPKPSKETFEMASKSGIVHVLAEYGAYNMHNSLMLEVHGINNDERSLPMSCVVLRIAVAIQNARLKAVENFYGGIPAGV